MEPGYRGDDESFMRRAIQLAELGRNYAHPNPMVGAVIVNDGRIIGEGYHRRHGGAHAEVNAVNSVKDKTLLQNSKIYVTLEPCAHYGKTPPCADMLINIGIPEVIIGSRDPFEKVNGQGIKKMVDAGIKVTTGILEKECKELNKVFFTAHTRRRPYILLKWAESQDGYLGAIKDGKRSGVCLSTLGMKTLVHNLRSQYDAIMVAAGTVEADNPNLDVRMCAGNSPLKVILDSRGECRRESNVFKGGRVIYFSDIERKDLPENVKLINDVDTHDLQSVMERLYSEGISSVMVEGGATLLNRLIAEGLYDEIRTERSDVKLGKEGYGVVKR